VSGRCSICMVWNLFVPKRSPTSSLTRRPGELSEEGPALLLKSRFERVGGSQKPGKIRSNCACCRGRVEVTDCLFAAETIRPKGEATMKLQLCGRTIDAREFPTARAAIRHHVAAGGKAIRLDGRNLVVSTPDADYLEVAGVAFAYLSEYRGRVV